MYLVISGWGNTRSIIRMCKQCSELTRADTTGLLSSTEDTHIYISFSSKYFVITECLDPPVGGSFIATTIMITDMLVSLLIIHYHYLLGRGVNREVLISN